MAELCRQSSLWTHQIRVAAAKSVCLPKRRPPALGVVSAYQYRIGRSRRSCIAPSACLGDVDASACG